MKLSIITINYNDHEGMRRTLQSVAAQTCKDFEYIVIDGGSTDGSVNVIKEFASHITYWVSEPDKGIYNAMNKGVVNSKGDYCLFLNSGDVFHSTDVISRILPKIKSDKDIFIGKIIGVRSDGSRVRMSKNIEHIDPVFLLLQDSFPHPSSFIRTELLRKYPYDENLRIVSDWKFFLEVVRNENPRICHTNVIVSDYDLGGISATNWQLWHKERCQVISEIMTYSELLTTYRKVPPYACSLFSSISDSPRLQRYLTGLIRVLIILYRKGRSLYDRIRFR